MPSHVIHDFSYDTAKRRLSITFVSGRRYAYHEVPAAVYEDMRRSFAKGEFFNRHIKDRYSVTAER